MSKIVSKSLIAFMVASLLFAIIPNIASANESSDKTEAPVTTEDKNLAETPTEPAPSSTDVPLANVEKNPEVPKDEEKPKDLSHPNVVSTDPIPSKQNVEFKNQGKLKADEFSGALSYNYALSVPAGRNNLQPNLSLSYSSQNTDNLSSVGYGWGITLPSIERQNKTGSDKLYTDNYFSSSEAGELIGLGSGEYVPINENGQFIKFRLSNNSWIVKDKSGTVYKYGATAQARQDNPLDPAKVYKWMLEEVRDTNNNFIRFEYSKNLGQIYPSKIFYTGNGSVDGDYQVLFTLEAKSDLAVSMQAGFKIQTANRIQKIELKFLGQTQKEYDFAYVAGDNSLRSLLHSITEKGTDDLGQTLSNPPTIFDYQTKVTNWTKDPNYLLPNNIDNKPIYFENENASDQHQIQMADINGDGLVDYFESRFTDTVPRTAIYINQGNGTWQESTTWTMPTDPLTTPQTQIMFDATGRNCGFRLYDINGDNLVDFIRSYQEIETNENGQQVLVSHTGIWINNGVNGWNRDMSYTLPNDIDSKPINFANFERTDKEQIQLVDVNGDGLVDFFESRYTDTVPRKAIYINQGNGTWQESTTWKMPYDASDNGDQIMFTDAGLNRGFRFVDLNNDGLADVVKSYRTLVDDGNGHVISVSITGVYINNGVTGWDKSTNYTLPNNIDNRPISFSNEEGRDSQNIQLVDVNGDGLVDFFESRWDTNWYLSAMYINQGNGTWVKNVNWSMPNDPADSPAEQYMFSDSGYNRGYRLTDVNGDNVVDYVKSNRIYGLDGNGNLTLISQTGVWLGSGKSPDLLSHVTESLGGTTDIVYKGTPQYKNGSNLLNPKLPLSLLTVSQIISNDGNGNISTDNYSYENGKYYFADRFHKKFSGFEKIVKNDPAGNKLITYAHQGDSTNSSNGEFADEYSKIGKIYRTEVADSVGNLYSRKISKWDKADLGGDRKFVFEAQSLNQIFDGNATHKDTATTSNYDLTNGNLLSQTSFGEVNGNSDGTFTDTGTDKLLTSTAYASNTGLNIIGLPSTQIVTDQSGIKVKESKSYYDNLALGSVTKGNQTKTEDWKSGTTYINNQKTYDGVYGLPVTQTDPRGKVTNISYDVYHLYPSQILNPLNQATQFVYDYSLGKPKQVTDSNNLVTQIIYDGLDRVVTEKQPDLTTPSTLVTKATYSYTNQAVGMKVKKTDFLDSTNSVETYQYLDGFGRNVQTRTEAEIANSYITADTIYNNLGQVYKQSLPYFSAGINQTSPTADQTLYSVQTYDPVGRVVSTQTSIGTGTNAYDDFKSTTTNNLGKVKNFYTDAYQRLIKVEELNSGSTYSTNYTYDPIGNLTNITDALNNTRTFTYDGLGRKLTAQDLHISGDTVFGTWQYGYDDNGNLTQTIDPKNQTIIYGYDELNRPSTENFTGQPGVEVTYAYDTCILGKGKLCSAVNSSSQTTYDYNSLGGVAKEVKTIDTVTYQTLYAYNYLGGLTDIQNPDNSKVKYLFNSAGLLEQVQRKESTDTNFINVVSNFDYNPQGAVTLQNNNNGTITTNSYDSTKAYRLSRKLTTAPSSGLKLQDLNYTYDANGNITKIIDDSQTNSKKTVDYTYDDLDRLLTSSVTGLPNGGQNYTKTYTYNAIGNMLSNSDSGDYTYTTNLSATTNPHAPLMIGSVEYKYDGNGNVVNMVDQSLRPIPNGVGINWDNTWDYQNRLTQSIVDNKTTTFAYDHRGQRIKVSIEKDNNIYPTENYNLEKGTAVKHIMAGDLLVATVKGTGATAVVHTVHTDHLTGSNVVTNGVGVLEELMDYHPYGNIRLDEKSTAFSEQQKFAGNEYDSGTGFTYMQARYYNGITGRFLAQDPMFWEMPKEYLQDPQQQNSYSYARNNPLTNVDPSGELSIIIPGTNYDEKGWNKLIYGSDFYNQYKNQVGESPYIFNWSGQDNVSARSVASSNLAGFINSHKFKEGENLNIISHSHGGNVALQATDLLHHKIDNLVLDGTPIRGDYKFDNLKIGSVMQNNSSLDGVQILGGGQFFLNPISKTGEFGPAGRQLKGVASAKYQVANLKQASQMANAISTTIATKNPLFLIKAIINNHSSTWQDPKSLSNTIKFISNNK